MTERRDLHAGDEGPDVEALQRRLGLSKIDGKFGRHTIAALREWQAYKELPVTEIVDAETYATLFPEPKT